MAYYLFLEMIITLFTKYTFIPKFLPITSIANNIFPNISGTAIRISSKFGEPPPMIEAEKYMTEVEKYTEKLWDNWMMFDWPAVLLAIVYIGIYFLITRWLFLRRDL